MDRVVIIGGGVGGLAAACLLGKAGYDVTVLEKNGQLGGRAGQLQAKGFTFDTGPSWFLMPEVFARFFARLGERLEDHLQLERLSPGYRLVYPDGGLDITGNLARDAAAFDALEPGAGQRLAQYLLQAGQTYHTVLDHFLYSSYDQASDMLHPRLWPARTLPWHSTMQRQAAHYFRDPRLQQAITLPSLFLGTDPAHTPAIYNLLNHSLFSGVSYPRGGMYELVRTLRQLAGRYGVTLRTNANVERILTTHGQVRGVQVSGREVAADIVISNAGQCYTETSLLPEPLRDHSAGYWQRRTWSPSALLLYLGVGRRYTALAHHNLVVGRDWQRNLHAIFHGNAFPDDPSLYVCAPSRTDPTVAPAGCENLFVLVPIAAGLQYTPDSLKQYTAHILRLLEERLKLTGLRQHLKYQQAFCVQDFAERFNSPFGTALGLGHTLGQSAFFRPAGVSRKVQGLYYTGADVQPGVGLPAVLISAELLANRLLPAEDAEGDQVDHH